MTGVDRRPVDPCPTKGISGSEDFPWLLCDPGIADPAAVKLASGRIDEVAAEMRQAGGGPGTDSLRLPIVVVKRPAADRGVGARRALRIGEFISPK